MLTHLRQLVLQMGDSPLRQQRWITISPIQLSQIARDALIQQVAVRPAIGVPALRMRTANALDQCRVFD